MTRLHIEEHTITGLLGRNGAGKTTIMNLLTGQEFATSGAIEVFGANPVENAACSRRSASSRRASSTRTSSARRTCSAGAVVLRALGCRVRRAADQRVPRAAQAQDQEAQPRPAVAVGVIVGLASRAPLTFFDEPYLGLDAVARQKFYDLLLARLRGAPAHRHPVHPPDRRGEQPARARALIDDGPHHRRPGRGQPARHRDHAGRQGERGRRVRRRPRHPAPRRDRRPRLGERRRPHTRRSASRRPRRASSSPRSRCSSSSCASPSPTRLSSSTTHRSQQHLKETA